MRGMIERLMSGLLQSYEQLLTSSAVQSDITLNQVRALQLLFDLKFLANILISGHEESEVCAIIILIMYYFKCKFRLGKHLNMGCMLPQILGCKHMLKGFTAVENMYMLRCLHIDALSKKSCNCIYDSCSAPSLFQKTVYYRLFCDVHCFGSYY